MAYKKVGFEISQCLDLRMTLRTRLWISLAHRTRQPPRSTISYFYFSSCCLSLDLTIDHESLGSGWLCPTSAKQYVIVASAASGQWWLGHAGQALNPCTWSHERHVPDRTRLACLERELCDCAPEKLSSLNIHARDAIVMLLMPFLDERGGDPRQLLIAPSPELGR